MFLVLTLIWKTQGNPKSEKNASMERELGYEVQPLAEELLAFFNFQEKKSQF